MSAIKLLLTMLIPVLQTTIKNPKSVAKERAIIQQVSDLLLQILNGIPTASARRRR